MRLVGTTAMGIRLPIIGFGDDLVEIVASHVQQVTKDSPLLPTDVVAVTEAMVAKSEGNFATISDIASDVRAKFGDAEVGLVYPMLSRNRFYRILQGIAAGAKHVHILLSFPYDEVGNPLMDIEKYDDVLDVLPTGLVTVAQFRAAAGDYLHPFTGMDYIDMYQAVGDNISIYLSNNPRDILKLTKHVLIGEIHSRFITKKRLEKAGATTVYTLCDILKQSINGSGSNSKYGVLGSNLSGDDALKLFPNSSQEFVANLQVRLEEKTGVAPEVMVYADGAFKDPYCGIWELADPVVSPGFTARLGGRPDELKLKFVADSLAGSQSHEDKELAIKQMIQNKADNPNAFREGTTPRIYADLLGSLCDLIGGSGDKGTPVVLVRGYFDDYTTP